MKGRLGLLARVIGGSPSIELRANEFAQERVRHPKPVPITINTRAPSKWRFVDLETGEVYAWNEDRGRYELDLNFQVRDLPVDEL